MTQIAKLPKEQHTGAIASNRKENGFYKEIAIIGHKKGEWSKPISARFYCTGSVVYCCIWIGAKDFYVSGGGRAGGYGYHKESQALEDAIMNTGIKLAKAFGGCGDSAMSEALKAVVKKIGFNDKNSYLSTAHA